MNRRRASILALLAALGVGLAIVVSRRAPRSPDRVGVEAGPPSVGEAGGSPAKVTVFDDGIPFADRWIVFHDADGRVASFEKSDATGKAGAAVPEGGMITVAYGESLHHLITVVGVKPGESIIVGEAEDEGDGEGGTTVASARVALPGARTGAARYAVTMGVSETEVRKPEVPLTLSVLDRFVKAATEGDAGPPRFRVLGEAFGPGGDPLAYAFAWGNPPAGEDGGIREIKLPPWSAAYRSADALLVHPPAGLRTVRGNLEVVAPHDNRFVRPPRSADVGAETTLRFPIPEPLGDDVLLRLELAWDGGDKAIHLQRRHADGPMQIDLGRELLPRVSNAKIEPGSDPARPTLRWSVAEGGATGDATIVRLTWPATGEHVWTIVLPPNARGPVRLPALPDVLASWRPDGRPATVAVAILESSEYASYDEVRAKGIDVAAEGIDDDEDGSLRWSSTGNIAF